MTLAARLTFFTDVAEGRTGVADLAGLSPQEVAIIERVGLAQFAAGRYLQASRVFAAIEALDPHNIVNSMNRARALAAAGSVDEATSVLNRLINRGESVPAIDMVKALVLRASLLVKTEPDEARDDLLAARVLARHSPEAARLIVEVLS